MVWDARRRRCSSVRRRICRHFDSGWLWWWQIENKQKLRWCIYRLTQTERQLTAPCTSQMIECTKLSSGLFAREQNSVTTKNRVANENLFSFWVFLVVWIVLVQLINCLFFYRRASDTFVALDNLSAMKIGAALQDAVERCELSKKSFDDDTRSSNTRWFVSVSLSRFYRRLITSRSSAGRVHLSDEVIFSGRR